MLEVLTSLFDSTGFTRRAECGTGWTSGLIWLHATSDLLIWLAYLSIPLVLLYFTRRRDLPFPQLFILFALFILACGTTHLLDALLFQYPVYRFAGLMKAVTAVVSWVTVFALIQVTPRVMTLVSEAERTGTGTQPHHPLTGAGQATPMHNYIIAILVGVLAILVRATLNPLLTDDHIFVVALLGVVYVSWRYGFRPGLVTLVISVGGYSYFFVSPRNTFYVEGLGNQLAIALFFFCGVACAALGESQQVAQRRAKAALASALARQEELESEVTRRRVVEAALRQREGELTTAQNQTAEALARLDAFIDNAPVGIVFFDQNLKYERINAFLATANGKPESEHLGRALTEMFPDCPPELVSAYSRIAKGEAGVYSGTQHQSDSNTGQSRAWQVTAFPVRRPDGRALGAGVVAYDITERLKAEQELQRSERNLADFFENANVGLHWVDTRSVIVRANRAELELLGYARDEYVGHKIEEFHESRETICEILARLRRGERLDNYPARLRCKDQTTRDVLISSSALVDDGKFVHSRCFTRDITEQKRAADELAEKARATALRADVASVLAAARETNVALQTCAETLVRSLGAAFARVWTTDATGEWLELQASAGMYTHLYGPHSRVRVGEFKIGRIAQTGTAHMTNDIPNDLNVSDPTWATHERMQSFVGYPLVVEDRVLGVLALFSRVKMSDTLMADLGPVAASVAQYIDRRRTSGALNESEERFHTMADSAPALIWLSEPDQRRTYFNKTWLEFTGHSMAQSLGFGWVDDIHPDDLALYLETYARATERRVPFELEYRLRRHDGASRWVLARGTPRVTATGTFVGFVGLCLDVTDRRDAETAVRRSEDRYRMLTEAVPQIVWTADPRGEVTFFNHRWTEYTGTKLESGRETGWAAELLHPEDADQFRTGWQLAVAQQADRFSQELRLRRAADGEFRWFLSAAVPVRNANGTVDEWVGTLTDIDDQKRQTAVLARMVRDRTAALEKVNATLVNEVAVRKEAEEKVRDVAFELERSNGELEKFAYIASHDLQEPLRKIQAFGDRLATTCRDELPDKGKEYVDRMLAAADRMRRLIDDLLSFSRVTSHPRPFKRIDLTELVNEVVSDLDVPISQANATVVVGSLPRIDADTTQMRQLFQNLIANAVKFQRLGVPPVVEIAGEFVTPTPSEPDAGEGPSEFRVTVRDNGIGFDEKYRERIFEVFQRLHGRNEYEGTGVGLATCRKIAEWHGGTITAHSREGEGATFVVILPVRQHNSRVGDDDDDATEQADHDSDGR